MNKRYAFGCRPVPVVSRMTAMPQFRSELTVITSVTAPAQSLRHDVNEIGRRHGQVRFQITGRALVPRIRQLVRDAISAASCGEEALVPPMIWPPNAHPGSLW